LLGTSFVGPVVDPLKLDAATYHVYAFVFTMQALEAEQSDG